METENAKLKENICDIHLSYINLRQLIGWAGILLPFLIWVVSKEKLNSVSDYYYTTAGFIFISVLSLCGFFLITYKGYKVKEGELVSDNIVTILGGIALFMVVIVPTIYKGILPCTSCPDIQCPTPICTSMMAWGNVHFASAIIFFMLMGFMSAFQFTKGIKSRKKNNVAISTLDLTKDFIYKVCGYGMWLVLIFAGIMRFGFHYGLGNRFIYWIEVVLLMLFGISWLVKGKTLEKFGFGKE